MGVSLFEGILLCLGLVSSGKPKEKPCFFQRKRTTHTHFGGSLGQKAKLLRAFFSPGEPGADHWQRKGRARGRGRSGPLLVLNEFCFSRGRGLLHCLFLLLFLGLAGARLLQQFVCVILGQTEYKAGSEHIRFGLFCGLWGVAVTVWWTLGVNPMFSHGGDLVDVGVGGFMSTHLAD